MLYLIYFLGIISCGMQGSEKSASEHNQIKAIIASFLTAFGGGLIRDLFWLNCYPAVLTPSCSIDIMIALLSGIIWFKTNQHSCTKWLILFFDSAGLGQFISIGVDKALDCNANSLIVLMCGITTALGGGILTSVLCGESWQEALNPYKMYRLITVMGTVLYFTLLMNEMSHITAQWLLVGYTFVGTTVCNEDVKKAIYDYAKNRFKSWCHTNIQYISNACLLAMISFYSKTVCCDVYQIANKNYYSANTPCLPKQRTLLFRRIRQM